MKTKIFMPAILIALMLTAVTVRAVEWNGKPGIGIRGPIFIPFDDIGGPEPYRIGIDGSVFLKYGLTDRFVIDLSGGYAKTYDDTSATKDANTKFMKKDLATASLNGILFGLTGNFYFRPDTKIQPYLLAGLGLDIWSLKTIAGSASTKFTDLDGKFGLGLNFGLSDKTSIDFQVKASYGLANISSDDNSPFTNYDFSDWKKRPFRGYIEPSIGITYAFGKEKDSDMDGVSDKNDRCPDTPAGAVVDEYGCPLDSDGDGIFDGLDRCPDTPRKCVVDITGCPLDSDKDGVCDGLDRCPNTVKGCPVDPYGCQLDADNDGICDSLDKCPNTPAGCLVDKSGCTLDGDSDGVCDGIDRCPTTPAGVKVDAFGCPVTVKAPVKKITLNIKYKTGSYEPDEQARQILDDLVQTMQAYTGTIIEVDGFTDNVGSDSSNTVLSQKRAEGVVKYLSEHGVETKRMTAKGFGEDPKFFVGDNKTAEGKQKNRRVEIISIEK